MRNRLSKLFPVVCALLIFTFCGHAAAQGQEAEEPVTASDVSVIGTWLLGMVSGEELNTASGRYEGGPFAMGQVYVFHADGTYQALVLWSEALYFTGKYHAQDGILTLTERTLEESADGGTTWAVPESLPDASAPYVTGTEDDKAYLLIGEEDATLPLLDKENTLKYRSKD